MVALPPVVDREDLDLAVARETLVLDPAANLRDIDHAIAHHAPVVEQVGSWGEPIADVKRQQAALAGALDLRLELRVPPYVVEIDRDA